MRRLLFVVLLSVAAIASVQGQSLSQELYESKSRNPRVATMVSYEPDGGVEIYCNFDMQTNRQDTLSLRYELGALLESIIYASISPREATCDVSATMLSDSKLVERQEQNMVTLTLDLEFLEQCTGPADSADQRVLLSIQGKVKSSVTNLLEEDGSTFSVSYPSSK